MISRPHQKCKIIYANKQCEIDRFILYTVSSGTFPDPIIICSHVCHSNAFIVEYYSKIMHNWCGPVRLAEPSYRPCKSMLALRTRRTTPVNLPFRCSWCREASMPVQPGSSRQLARRCHRIRASKAKSGNFGSLAAEEELATSKDGVNFASACLSSVLYSGGTEASLLGKQCVKSGNKHTFQACVHLCAANAASFGP